MVKEGSIVAEKKTFLMYMSWDSSIAEMTDEEAGQLLKAAYAYQKGEDIELDRSVKIFFRVMEERFKEDSAKYQKKVETLNKNKGTDDSNQKSDRNQSEISQKSDRNQNEINSVSESVSVSVYDSVSESVSGTQESTEEKGTPKGVQKKNFVPPTVDEVADYCAESGYSVDAERFVDFYEAKGWMIGKNKMRDWRAAVRTWRRQDRASPKSQIDDLIGSIGKEV